MGKVIAVSTERFTEKPLRAPRRVTDPTTRAPINATVEDIAAVIHSVVRIPGTPEQAKVMRRHIRMIAGAQHREMPIIETLASELFNNAIKHTRSGDAGGEITVVVIKMPGRIQVKVLDQGPRPHEPSLPRVREPEFDADGGLLSEGGFGLRLVDGDATQWGVITDPGRTTVWFELARISDTAAQA